MDRIKRGIPESEKPGEHHSVSPDMAGCSGCGGKQINYKLCKYCGTKFIGKFHNCFKYKEHVKSIRK